MIGNTISHYRITEKLGSGGMGEVYLAEDKSLGRKVALKFLPSEMQCDPIAHMRFQREAWAAAALDHPFICSIHEVGEAEGKDYIVMEYVEGETLRARLDRGPLPLPGALHVAAEIAEAIEQAHEKQILHRDLKPTNIMITHQGHAKVMDFGLAKQVIGTDQVGSHEDTLTILTKEGTTVGTLEYMSPEQLRGQAAETRSDIFSFGIVFSEMLTGVHPFRQASPMDTAAAILERAPVPLADHLKNAPELLHKMTARMLAKELAGRYSSIREVRADLALLIKQVEQEGAAPSAAESRGLWQRLGKPVFVVPALLIIIALGYLAATTIQQNRKTRWAREQALPEIERLVEQEKFLAAFRLANEARRTIPSDPVWNRLDPLISRVASVTTKPSGAKVYCREYGTGEKEWTYLGESPLTDVRIPNAFFEWKVEKKGFVTAEDATGQYPTVTVARPKLAFTLQEQASGPPGMVYVTSGDSPLTLHFPGFEHLPPVTLHDFWIDKYEVTNREFKRFVDAGGYRNSTFWRHQFVRDGRPLTFEQAIHFMTDSTGRIGPATWESGGYPEGQDDFPVSGVSWYEASAYAQWAGKSLPTIYHWSRVADQYASAFSVPRTNFKGKGLMKVGESGGMNRFGAYDMAGNVKEWCWNSANASKRYILGGAWDEPIYMFNDADAQPPCDRRATYGFRCVKYSTGESLTDASAELVLAEARDYNKEKPVGDAVFQVYRQLYSYDKTDLESTVESVDDQNPDWKRENVSFTAGYGKERLPAALLVPKAGRPPYQAVVVFPGSGALLMRSSSEMDLRRFDWVMKSGRAAIQPVYKSTFERGDDLRSDYPNRSAAYRDHVIAWAREVSRSIDYLETRKDISSDRIAFLGFSWGAAMGPVFVALEPRFKACILVQGGFNQQHALPEVDALNFAPRVMVPVLLLGGRYDFFFPTDTSQLPMFRLLGVPNDQKRYVVYETGHTVPRADLIRESLDWLDRYLGPVR